MKARLTGVFLCIGAFVLSMLLLLQLFNQTINQGAVLGENTQDEVLPPVSGEDSYTDLSSEVKTLDDVKTLAVETQNYFSALATLGEAPSVELSAMIQKWHNAASVLKNDYADASGGAYYTALETAFSEYTSNPPTDVASFSEMTLSVLDALSVAQSAAQGDVGRYPVLDLSEEGQVAMALLRLRNASENTASSITVTFGGEVALGDELGKDSYKEKYGLENAKNPLSGLIPVFATDDLTIVSLAAPLTAASSENASVKNAFRGASAETYALHLKQAGVDAVILSTCHIRDFGNVGYDDTVKALTDAGLKVVEEGVSAVVSTDAGKVAIHTFDLSRHDVRRKDVESAVAETKEQSPILNVVYFHTSDEEGKLQANVNALRAAADAGADLVLSSHGAAPEGLLFRGEDQTALVLSPGQLSRAIPSERVEGETLTFLYQQSFEIENAQVKEKTIPQLFAVNNHAFDEAAPYAPSLALKSATVQELSELLVGSPDGYEGRVTDGDVSFVSLSK